MTGQLAYELERNFEVDSSHVPMLSKPKFVLDVSRTAASSIQESRPSLRPKTAQ